MMFIPTRQKGYPFSIVSIDPGHRLAVERNGTTPRRSPAWPTDTRPIAAPPLTAHRPCCWWHTLFHLVSQVENGSWLQKTLGCWKTHKCMYIVYWREPLKGSNLQIPFHLCRKHDDFGNSWDVAWNTGSSVFKQQLKLFAPKNCGTSWAQSFQMLVSTCFNHQLNWKTWYRHTQTVSPTWRWPARPSR